MISFSILIFPLVCTFNPVSLALVPASPAYQSKIVRRLRRQKCQRPLHSLFLDLLFLSHPSNIQLPTVLLALLAVAAGVVVDISKSAERMLWSRTLAHVFE